jgi:small subunit ribosomal protein S16
LFFILEKVKYFHIVIINLLKNMLKMRFKRCGKKQQPTYKIVIMLSTSGRDSRAIKNLGFYNPITKEIKLDIFNIIKNLKYGVQPTKTVKNLLMKTKIVY